MGVAASILNGAPRFASGLGLLTGCPGGSGPFFLAREAAELTNTSPWPRRRDS